MASVRLGDGDDEIAQGKDIARVRFDIDAGPFKIVGEPTVRLAPPAHD